MEVFQDIPSPHHVNDLFERLTLGVAKSLEKRQGMCNVKLSENPPAPRHTIVGWEQKNASMLPDDIKNFYLTTDGLLLTWSVHLENETFPAGKMEINSISNLLKLNVTTSTKLSTNIPSLADADCSCSEDEEEEGKCVHPHPHFDNRSRIFELEDCNSHGKVCLAYTQTAPGIPAHKPEIWFLDRSLKWHFLAPDFTSYYRIMLMHLGLPHWHCAVTDIGPSLQQIQWFNMYAPVRKDLNSAENKMEEITTVQAPNTSSKIDFSRVFKGKTIDKVKTGKTANTGLTPRKRNNTNFSSATSVKSSGSRNIGKSSKPWT